MTKMTDKTPKACVIGNPVAHSLSPYIHQYWLEKAGCHGAYMRKKSTPATFENDLDTLFADPCFRGANITVPFKTKALNYAAQVSKEARIVGAANVLRRAKNGQIVAENTDIAGFLAPLAEKTKAQTLRKAVIIGAGGAARAVIYACHKQGIKNIILTSRTDEKTRHTAKALQNMAKIETADWKMRAQSLEGADLLVNASAGGMSGGAPLDFSLAGLPEKALVYDLVYTPRQTALLEEAAARGHTTIGGLDMLIAQAQPSFAWFFGAFPKDADGARRVAMQILEDGP